MDKTTSAKIQGFVRPEWDGLRRDLHEAGMKISDKDEIPNALLYSARRFPVEAIKAIIETFWEREAEAKGSDAELSD